MGETLKKMLDELRENTPEPGVEYTIRYQHIRWTKLDEGSAGNWCHGCDECKDGYLTIHLTRVEGQER